MYIWTWGTFPFVMGGPVRQAVKTDVESTSGPHDLGHGYEGYVITTPAGNTRVAEATTGALVGDTLDDVRRDVADASPEAMRDRVAAAADHVRTAKTMTPAEFWRLMKETPATSS